MRIILLCLALLSGIGVVNAQKFGFGVQAGSNFAVQSQIADYYSNQDILIGLHSGVFMRYALTEKIALQAEINYDRLGSNKGSTKNELDYINVPVLINYSLGKSDLTPLNFEIYTGPYIGNLLKAESTVKTSEIDQTLNVKDNTNQISGGVILGFGVRYPINTNRILLDFRLGLGLAPYDKNDYEPKNKYFGISLGYQF